MYVFFEAKLPKIYCYYVQNKLKKSNMHAFKKTRVSTYAIDDKQSLTELSLVVVEKSFRCLPFSTFESPREK